MRNRNSSSNSNSICKSLSFSKEETTTTDWVEESQYHWLFHFIFLSIIPLYHLASWKVCERLRYSQVSAASFLVYPVWSYVIIPFCDISMTHCQMFGRFERSVATRATTRATSASATCAIQARVTLSKSSPSLLSDHHPLYSDKKHHSVVENQLTDSIQMAAPSPQSTETVSTAMITSSTTAVVRNNSYNKNPWSFKRQVQEFQKDGRKYTLVLRVYAICHTFMFLYSIYKLKDLSDAMGGEWWKSFIFWAQLLNLGMSQAAPGSAVSHELYHRLTKLDRFLGNLLLTIMMYAHFSIEHVYGHHKNVATVHDPATARFNQNFYHFFIQSVFKGYWNSWRIENERIQQQQQQQLKGPGIGWLTWMKQNRILKYSIICYLLLPLAVIYWRGWIGLVALLTQSFVGILFVELINYFEHYGLERAQNSDGSFEPVQDWHSWDRPTGHFSKLSYCNLILHSDHHHHPLKHYEYLEQSKNKQTPILPYTYSTMALITLVPPLFFHIVHKTPIFQDRLLQLQQQQKPKPKSTSHP